MMPIMRRCLAGIPHTRTPRVNGPAVLSRARYVKLDLSMWVSRFTRTNLTKDVSQGLSGR